MIKAVVFDIGGVLEKVDDASGVRERSRLRTGLTEAEFEARRASVDPHDLMITGAMDEATYRRRNADAFGWDDATADAFLAGFWDWYCGELDTELADFLRDLRPAYRTGILSNSCDGARREEQARYGFPDLVDELVYSHEIGLAKPDPRAYLLTCERLGVQPQEAVFLDDSPPCVEGARAVGMHAVVHLDTPTSIAAVTTLLARR